MEELNLRLDISLIGQCANCGWSAEQSIIIHIQDYQEESAGLGGGYCSHCGSDAVYWYEITVKPLKE